MIDLLEINPGDTAIFRSGGRAIVESVRKNPDRVLITFLGATTSLPFSHHGCHFHGRVATPFDIVEIEKGPSLETGTVWVTVYKDEYTNEIKSISRDWKPQSVDDVKVLAILGPFNWTEGQGVTK